MRDRNHRHVLLDEAGGLFVQRKPCILICNLPSLGEHTLDVVESRSELTGGTGAEVEVQEVGGVGVVGAPTEHVHRELAGVARVEERTRLHDFDVDVDADVSKLVLDVDADGAG